MPIYYKYTILFLLILGISGSSPAQADFYSNTEMQEIKIYFDQSNWDEILDSLYIAGNEERMKAHLVINGTAIDCVGIRYKGYSSASTSRDKNPFNIKLDHYVNGQEYNGVDKIKLSNVIQDPSFIREALSYEIARKYMPASQANFANVFINDIFWGVYTNVEDVGSEFLKKHFNSKDNAFVKGNPSTVDLNGENSNLSQNPGSDSTNYYDLYDMKSDHGWKELLAFIDTLNNYQNQVSSVLNVDRALWMHAFNYAVINFDSYVGYAQNYYLYEDDYGRFNPILWDMNMSFGSYRLTDASEHYSGFSIQEAKVMDPLLHLNSVSVFPRPLMRYLFENDTYKRMYLAHMRTIIEENFSNQWYAQRGSELQDLIDTSVLADTNKFYSYTHFLDNLNSTVTDLVDYPGITDFMDERSTFLSTYPGFQGAPSISNVQTQITNGIGGELSVTCHVSNEHNVLLAYRNGEHKPFTIIEMVDDASENDGAANDGIYGATIHNVGNYIQYYFYAENDSAGQFSPARAAYEFYEFSQELQTGQIVINEVLASNDTYNYDQSGDYDDWIEVYNTTSTALNLKGLYISDEENSPFKYELPTVEIGAGDYLLVWADKDTHQSGIHTNFTISAAADSIYLTYEDSTLFDHVYLENQDPDVAWGRIPNGSGTFEYLYPSPLANNETAGVEEIVSSNTIELFPNPATDFVYLRCEEYDDYSVEIFNLEGQLIASKQFRGDSETLLISNYPKGLYFIQIITQTQSLTKRLIIQ